MHVFTTHSLRRAVQSPTPGRLVVYLARRLATETHSTCRKLSPKTAGGPATAHLLCSAAPSLWPFQRLFPVKSQSAPSAWGRVPRAPNVIWKKTKNHPRILGRSNDFTTEAPVQVGDVARRDRSRCLMPSKRSNSPARASSKNGDARKPFAANKYDELFDRVDTNVDGEIDASELRLAMTTEHKVRISANQVSTSVPVSLFPL